MHLLGNISFLFPWRIKKSQYKKFKGLIVQLKGRMDNFIYTFIEKYMDQEAKKTNSASVEQAVIAAMSDPKYWARKRNRWEEWGSPVGLGLAWALFIVPIGIFLWLLHLAGII